MKSLLVALHLLVLLLFLAIFHIFGQAAVSAAEIVVTTTAQPPSLRAPHRSSAFPTRVMSTERRASTPAIQRQKTPIARSSTMAHATTKQTPQPQRQRQPPASALASDHALASATKSNSARPLRSIGARQNRSLQSALSSTTVHSSNTNTNSNNNNNGNSLTAVGNHQQKHERAERRHHFRTNQYGSHETIKSTTTTTTQATVPLGVSTNAHTTSHRQSKDSSMPLDGIDGDEVAKNATKQQQQHQRQTSKTPRMIHRLIAGHIQNAEGHSTYQVSSVSSNRTVSRSTPTTTTSTTSKPMTSKADSKPLKTSARYSAAASVKPIKLQTILSDPDSREDDEALLDDPGDFDNWDNGILRLSAGSGKESSKSKKVNKDKDDSKKTLSDQVRDGKYGLIEKELFRREPKRPGVLSYLPNKEVPVDNERNYGGLQEDDIWLAEDHLLVIKGGSLNEDNPREEPWAPIDDYDAPGRQIKIPSNPKVPPPFPVQLEENGPVQFIGNSKFTVVYPVANESIPVYTAGTEADNTPSENEGDNEKNFLARPGAPKSTANGEPQYVYPAPYPSWLFDNQTFVNPLLSNARPITFPGLGPFPYGRNGSLENSNITDYFDEDDPNLYYPPAYSFVYKNNYSNPVPPGPLVPGIVLPPPANQFSRLEKSEKLRPSSPTILTRQRIPISTSTTTVLPITTTTTTTTPSPSPSTTTTEKPFRAVITKISEYTPKIINITPVTPTVSTSIPSTPTAKLPPTPPSSPLVPITPPISPLPIEPVPVPVAIPIPIYPNRHYSPSRPNIIAFVPTTPGPATAPLSKANPIYYEYFEAKRQPIKTNVIDDFLATTVEPPPSPKPIKLYSTSKRPFKAQQHHNYYQSQPVPLQQRIPYKDSVVYITPKPEIRYKVPASPPIFKTRPIENFEREVSALRETLRYYQNQQLRDNSIPRTPKVKPIYEFTFDASKNLQRPDDPAGPEFRPPLDFDNEPFKPMVTYSPPMNDENSFNPMAYEKADIEISQRLAAEGKQLDDSPNYQSTTTLLPVAPDAEYQLQPQTPQGRLKKQRLSAKYLQEPFIDQQQQQQQPLVERNTQRPWVAIGKVSVPQNVFESSRLPEEQNQRYEQFQYAAPKHRAYPGYFYGPPPPPPPPAPVHSRQNNRYYEEPFQSPVRKIVNQRQRPNVNYQQSPQQNYWGLENDTYVNFAPNRPPVNPDAEFIDPYQGIPVGSPYAGHDIRYSQPALSHQSQYYAPQQQQRLPPQIPLHRDILVNYRQPLPPINPDSEFINHPQVVRNQANQIYRSESYQRLTPPLIDGEDETRGVYYASPKYRRAHNSNNNAGNGGSNGNKQSREGRSASNNDEDDKK